MPSFATPSGPHPHFLAPSTQQRQEETRQRRHAIPPSHNINAIRRFHPPFLRPRLLMQQEGTDGGKTEEVGRGGEGPGGGREGRQPHGGFGGGGNR